MINWVLTYDTPDYYVDLVAAGVDEDLAADAANILENAGDICTEAELANAFCLETEEVAGRLEEIRELEDQGIAKIPEITELTNEDGETVYYIAMLEHCPA